MYLRVANNDDTPFLQDVLLQAFNWSNEQTFSMEQILSTPEIAHYIAGWMQPSDFGTVALSDGGDPIGAVWGRLLTSEDPGYGFVSETVPELTMGVLPEHRGSGAGTALMAAVITQAREAGFEALSLSVEDHNPASRLYARAGFNKVDRTGDSDTMLLRLT